MYLMLCYDIPNSARRGRLFKRLHGYLRPVQMSVFEGELPDSRWAALLALVDGTIDPEEDNVRIYALCRACRGLLVVRGVATTLPDAAEPVIV